MTTNGFRAARAKTGKRQVEAACALGIAFETLSRIERGVQEPGRNLLERMADLYECSVDFLLGRTTAALPDAPPTPDAHDSARLA